MCACGYSFVNVQQTEPRRADVSSTNKDRKRDKKRDKGASETSRSESVSGEKPAKKKKSGRGFALFAFLLLAVFVVAILLPANTRGPLVNFDKGFYHPVGESDSSASATDKSSDLYAETDANETDPAEPEPTPDDPAPTDKWIVTFKNGNDVVGTVEVTKGDKLTSDQFPPDPSVESGKEFKGWFNGDTAITVETVIDGDVTATAKIEDAVTQPSNPSNPDQTDPDPDQTEQTGKLGNNIYGWDFISDIIGIFSDETKAQLDSAENKFDFIVNDYFGTSTFVLVVIFAVFILTAFFHLLVCIVRVISPKRSKRPNYLYLTLAVITTVLVAMMSLAHLIPNEESGFRLFFEASYKGLSCEYGLMIWVIPVYYWFFWLYSYIAKRKSPKKEKKSKKS